MGGKNLKAVVVRRLAEPVHIGTLRDFEAMLSRYCRLRGWDENGIPTPETLRRLELDKWTLSFAMAH